MATSRGILGVLAAGLLLSACAGAVADLELTKAGVSDAEREKDSAACWNFALHTQEGRTKADVARVKGAITGGVVSTTLNVQGAPDEARKQDVAYKSVYAQCMRGKGYT